MGERKHELGRGGRVEQEPQEVGWGVGSDLKE